MSAMDVGPRARTGGPSDGPATDDPAPGDEPGSSQPWSARPGAPTRATQHGSPQPLTHRQILTILAGLLLGMFLAALDQTIVATSVRVISDDLHGLSLQAWATTAYLITATITTPLYGKLSDLYGRRPFFLTAIVLFMVGSLLCAVPTSMEQLAVARGVQGMGAGGLFSLAMAAIGDLVPPRERGRYQGYFAVVFGTASVLGPLVGGFFAAQDTLLGIDGWRWVFLINLPLGLLATVVVVKVLHLPPVGRARRIDWAGALCLTAALIPLLLVTEQGRTWGWASERSVLCYVIGAIGLVAFVVAEWRIGDDALLPLRLFRHPVLSLGSTLNVLLGMAMFGGLAVLPQYLQIVQGASPTEAGLLTVPLMVAVLLASQCCARITVRTGRYKIFPVIGTALLTLGLVLFSRMGTDTPLWQADVFMGIYGLGLGCSLHTLATAVQNAVHPKDMGVASASTQFFRQLGGALGTAVLLSILFSTAGERIGTAFREIVPTPEFQAAVADPAVRDDPANAPVLDLVTGGGPVGGNVAGVLEDSSFLGNLDTRLAQPFLVGFADSMSLVFLVAAPITALGFVLILFLPEVPLRTRIGSEVQAAELTGAPAAAPRAGRHARTAASAARRVGKGPGPGHRDDPGQAPRQASEPVLRGTVRAADGSPLIRARVTVIDLAGRQHGKAVADRAGRYRLSAPPPGRYLLVCAAESFTPEVCEVLVGQGEVRLDVTLTPAAAPGPVRPVATGAHGADREAEDLRTTRPTRPWR